MERAQEEGLFLVVGCERILSTPEGEPVFTVSSDEELQAVVNAHGSAPLEPAETTARRSRIYGGVVIAVGQEMAPAAELYAHLTQRGCKRAASIREALAEPGVEVVIASVRDCTLNALKLVSAARPTVGLLVAATSDAARLQVLSRAAFARKPKQPLQSTLLIVGNEGLLDPRTRNQQNVVLPASSSQDVRRALSGRVDLLAVVAHADGIDAQLSREAVLCPFSSAPIPSETARQPACLNANYCRRLGQPLDQALSSRRLISPREISCGVLVLATCFGASGNDSMVEFQFSSLHALLQNASIGAIVTSWGIVFTKSETGSELLGQCSRSALGPALDRLSVGDTVTSGLFRPILFGDPRAGFIPRSPEPPEPPRLPKRPTFNRPTNSLEFLIALATTAATIGGREGSLAECVAALRNATRQPGVVNERRAQKLLLAIVAPLGIVPIHLWARFAGQVSIVSTREALSCSVCALETELFQVSLPSLTRWLLLCPRCGVVFDGANAPTADELRSIVALATELGSHELTIHDRAVSAVWINESVTGAKTWGEFGADERASTDLVAHGTQLMHGLDFCAVRTLQRDSPS